jgi:hypothetical protein
LHYRDVEELLAWNTVKPEVGTMHLCVFQADRNSGFSASVSSLAFMSWFPIFMSLAQNGTKPHRIVDLILRSHEVASRRMEPGFLLFSILPRE